MFSFTSSPVAFRHVLLYPLILGIVALVATGAAIGTEVGLLCGAWPSGSPVWVLIVAAASAHVVSAILLLLKLHIYIQCISCFCTRERWVFWFALDMVLSLVAAGLSIAVIVLSFRTRHDLALLVGCAAAVFVSCPGQLAFSALFFDLCREPESDQGWPFNSIEGRPSPPRSVRKPTAWARLRASLPRCFGPLRLGPVESKRLLAVGDIYEGFDAWEPADSMELGDLRPAYPSASPPASPRISPPASPPAHQQSDPLPNPPPSSQQAHHPSSQQAHQQYSQQAHPQSDPSVYWPTTDHISSPCPSIPNPPPASPRPPLRFLLSDPPLHPPPSRPLPDPPAPRQAYRSGRRPANLPAVHSPEPIQQGRHVAVVAPLPLLLKRTPNELHSSSPKGHQRNRHAPLEAVEVLKPVEEEGPVSLLGPHRSIPPRPRPDHPASGPCRPGYFYPPWL